MVKGLECPVKERILPLFLADRRSRSVARVDDRIVGQGEELPPYRIEDRLHVAPEEVGSAYGPGKKGVPYEYRSVEEDAHAALRMSRRVQHLSALPAELDRIAGRESSCDRNVLGISEPPHRGVCYRHLENVEVVSVHDDIDPVFGGQPCRGGHVIAVSVGQYDQDRPDAGSFDIIRYFLGASAGIDDDRLRGAGGGAGDPAFHS